MFWKKIYSYFQSQVILLLLLLLIGGATCVSILGTGYCTTWWVLFLFAGFIFYILCLIFMPTSVWSQNIHSVVSWPKLEVSAALKRALCETVGIPLSLPLIESIQIYHHPQAQLSHSYNSTSVEIWNPFPRKCSHFFFSCHLTAQ